MKEKQTKEKTISLTALMLIICLLLSVGGASARRSP